MRIDFKGNLEDKRELRCAVIGCGSHAFRNIFPTFQFTRTKLIATCDYYAEKAKAYCEKFGGEHYYTDYREMLARERLDAVFVIVSNTEAGRPGYSAIAAECLRAGVNVMIEKPPAAVTSEIEMLMRLSKETGKRVMVAYKKMFVQAYRKAKELALAEDFGGISMMTLMNPEQIPSMEDLQKFLYDGVDVKTSRMCMEHLCHPLSQMISLLGAPESMLYDRNECGAGVIVFQFPHGAMATLHMNCGMAMNGGVERTVIISRQGLESGGRSGGRHIIMDNNLVLTYNRNPSFSYGDETDFYKGTPNENTAVWQPEFSRGQMFNKGLFLLGYFGEINEFAEAILENRPFADGTLEQAWAATQVFEKLAEGPGKRIPLAMPPELMQEGYYDSGYCR